MVYVFFNGLDHVIIEDSAYDALTCTNIILNAYNNVSIRSIKHRVNNEILPIDDLKALENMAKEELST